ncbi:MAG: hypothetical protein FIB02_00805 [Desulfuromonas sp.]|nr:hypothetical protein [Desulfuromonas sp.]
METIRFLTTCALVEDKAAEIYRAMAVAARAQNDEELAALWQTMAVDEENHAQQVRLAMRLSREKVFAELKAEEEGAALALLARAEDLLQRVTASSVSEEEMLRVASDLEKRFQKIHTTYTIVFQESSMKKMFDALARADDTHLAGLQARIKKFSGEPSAE